MINLSKRILSFRESRSLSQLELAEKIGIDRTALNKIENGKRKVTSEELVKIAQALNVSLDTLVGINTNVSQPISLDDPNRTYIYNNHTVPKKYLDIVRDLMDKDNN